MSKFKTAGLSAYNLNFLNGAYLTDDDLKSMLRIDEVAGEVDTFNYSLCSRLWLTVVQEKLQDNNLTILLYQTMVRRGLLWTINHATQCSDSILHGEEASGNMFYHWFSNSNRKVDIDVLLALRFPKRLCLDNVSGNAVSEFLDLNRDNWATCTSRLNSLRIPYGWYSYGTYMLKAVQKEALDMHHEMLTNTAYFTLFGSVDANPEYYLWKHHDDIATMGYYSSGASYNDPDTDLPTRGVLLKLLQSGFAYHTLHTDFQGIPTLESMRKYDYAIEVPKNYKKKRLIAINCPLRNFIGQAGRYAMAEGFKHLTLGVLRPDNQEISREYCLKGSKTKKYSTIDLSSASDSISYQFAQWILPPDVLRFIDIVRAKTIKVDAKQVNNRILFTSGASMCFNTEMYVFTAVCRAAMKMANTFLRKRMKTDDLIVYGDDIIVNDAYYDTVMDWLTGLGFFPNPDKSYGHDSHFRESCGLDAWNGTIVSSLYYPRKEMGTTNQDTLAALCKLQKQLYAFGCPNTSFILADILARKGVKGFPEICVNQEEDSIATFYTPWEAYEFVESPYVAYDEETIPEHKFFDGTRSLVKEVTGFNPYSMKMETRWTWEPNYRCVKARTIVHRRDITQEDKAFYAVTCFSAEEKRLRDVYHYHSATITLSEVIRLWEEYCYTLWLLRGPQYATKLDRILGIPIPRMSLHAFVGETRTVMSSTII